MIKLETQDLVSVKSVANKGNSYGVGGLTLIYHDKGKRIEFSKRVIEMLNHPKYIKFCFTDEYLVLVSVNEEDDCANFVKNKSEKEPDRKVIYNANLVKEILEHFKMDYSAQTSFTFNNIEAVDGIENAVAVKIR